MFYAESVLLINYKQAKVFEHNIILQKPVSADYNINLSFYKFFYGFFLFFWRSKAW